MLETRYIFSNEKGGSLLQIEQSDSEDLCASISIVLENLEISFLAICVAQ